MVLRKSKPRLDRRGGWFLSGMAVGFSDGDVVVLALGVRGRLVETMIGCEVAQKLTGNGWFFSRRWFACD